MTNPADTRFVRQVEVVTKAPGAMWQRGVIGFETKTMPKSGKMT